MTDALIQMRVPLVSVEALPQVPGDWLVHLAPGTSVDAMIAASGRVKADPRFAFASPAFKTVDDNAAVVLVNRLAVRFRPGVSEAAIDSLNAGLGTHIIRPPRPDSGFMEYWLAYPSGPTVDPLVVAAAYDRHPLVLWADPDKISDYQRQVTPTDPFYTSQYYLKDTITLNGVPVDDNVELAWNFTLGEGVPSSGGITVAVIDDGIDASQEDFGGRVLFGYDTFGNNSFGCTNCADAPFGDDYHGTAAAGLVGATQNNGLGVTGVAPAVWLLPVRIFRDELSGTACQIGDGISFAWQLGGADVLSNSWGGGAADNCITNAVNAAATQGRGGKGALVVFAAGNTSKRNGTSPVCGQPVCGLAYPATLDNVVAVGAIDRNGQLTNYTPEGPQLDLVAPSGHFTDKCPRLGGTGPFGDVVSTDRAGNAGCNDGPSMNVSYTSTFSGTSAAAPQVSGVGALLYSLEPGLTMSQARARIQAGADAWGPSTQYGAGKVDALFTLKPLGVGVGGPSDITQTGTYTWTATPSGGDGTYTYQWQVRNEGSATWVLLGTAQTQARNVNSSTPNFTILVTAKSLWRSASSSTFVTNELYSPPICNPRC